MWDPETGELIFEVQGGPGGVAGLSFDADGALVSAAWPEEDVRVVEAATGHVVQELMGIDTFVLSTG